MVVVFMRDQDRVRAGERLGLAPHTGIDNQRAALVLQADAGMDVLGNPHPGEHSPRDARGTFGQWPKTSSAVALKGPTP